MSEGGLRAIFLAERAKFLRLLKARLGNAEEAEDALHDLWLKLERGTDGPIADPVSYLYRMVNNLATDIRRRAARRADRETGWLQGQSGAAEQPDPERTLIARERLAQVEATLTKLPDRVAMAFRLYRFEELPHKAIAERMGISVSGVEKLLHRAYQRIHLHRPISGEDIRRERRLTCDEDRYDGR